MVELVEQHRALPVLFVCEPYQVKLTRESCADRHRLVSGRAGSKNHDERASASARLRFGKCVGCAVGAAHAAGEKPRVQAAAITPVQTAPEKPRAELKFDLRQEAQPRSVPPALRTPTPPHAASSASRVAPRPRLVSEIPPKEETMPKRSDHSARSHDARTCKAEGCSTSFVPTHGRQLYCAEHREIRTGSSASTKQSSAAARKAREDQKLDRILDTPVTPAKKPRKLRELPLRRAKKSAPATPATSSSSLEDAQRVLEMSGFEVTGIVRTPAGAVIAIRLGGVE